LGREGLKTKTGLLWGV